jgi:hypothetical protein
MYNGDAIGTLGASKMPTLVIDNMSESLFERIQQLVQDRRQKPSDAVVEVLEAALPRGSSSLAEERLPQQPFMTEEICAPCSIPRPGGQRIVPVEVADYVPNAHDIPAAK